MARPDNPLASRARALGLPMIFDHAVIPSTRRAHQAAEWARSQGAFEPFHRALLEAYWARGDDLHAFQVLRAAAEAVGLDGGRLEAEVSSGAWAGAVQAGLDAAKELGVHAVPTFIVGGRFVIEGAQDARVFAHAFERLGHAPRST